MIRRILLGLALASAPALVHAQFVPNANNSVGVIGRDTSSGLPCYIGGAATCVMPGAGGGGSSAPYAFTSTGYQQLTGVSTATGFTPPALSTTCYVTSETVSVRYRTDGTNPTASVGVLLAANQQLILTASLSTVKFIPTSGSTILDVDCYK